jgi:hypothetical protein
VGCFHIRSVERRGQHLCYFRRNCDRKLILERRPCQCVRQRIISWARLLRSIWCAFPLSNQRFTLRRGSRLSCRRICPCGLIALTEERTNGNDESRKNATGGCWRRSAAHALRHGGRRSMPPHNVPSLLRSLSPRCACRMPTPGNVYPGWHHLARPFSSWTRATKPTWPIHANCNASQDSPCPVF